MKSINRINKYPQKISDKDMQKYLDSGTKWVHESILRSYSILDTVKGMLSRWDSKETIQWIIEEMESDNTKEL